MHKRYGKKTRMLKEQEAWKIAGLVMLPVRFVQGWIFWGGGSRRFIYDPSKLDPHAHEWMANKLQSAMPGAILGVKQIIGFILQHFDLLYSSILIFSLIELLSGLALMLGFFSRLAGFSTMLISIVLMLAFGWQGATCMDEWTMAAATLSMGFALTLSGASIYSLDSFCIRKYPHLENRKWFTYLASGPIGFSQFKISALCILGLTVAFTLWTYNYYRGSILTPYHTGPVSAGKHHITLSNGSFGPNGSIKFTLYVDGGTPAIPSNIIRVELLNEKNQVVENWEGDSLSLVAEDKIQNEYAYNRVHTGQYGIVAPLSAMATITLAPPQMPLPFRNGEYRLVVFTINGNRFELPLNHLESQ